MIFDNVTYRDLITDFFKEYLTDFGRLKFDKIQNKILTSKKVSNLIQLSFQKRIAPSKNDYLYCLNEIPYFMFSKAETLALGALLFLERWNKECNSELHLLNDDTLKNIVTNILIDCKKLKM